MGFKSDFKNRLKSNKEGFEVKSNLSDLFGQLSEELSTEIESNKLLNFKHKLKETKNSITTKSPEENLFISLLGKTEVEQHLEEQSNYITEEIITEPVIKPPQIDYITTVIETISKEEKLKTVKENTNLFSEPNSFLPEVKSLQSKVKNLEDWVYKISVTGPGSGEVNFRWLDDVNRNTIGNTDQILRYNPDDKKFFFGQLSGDQGPIRSLEFANTGAGITPNPGTLEWNDAKDCLNIYQNDDSTLQVGLENYIRVHNSTANTLVNGTLVQFAGVNGDNETPKCSPLLANSSFVPLYTIGVLTKDIPSGESGRATVLGEVRNLNTTGSAVGETWNVGDLLWASPTNPGDLTKAQPTAPNPVISIAAVLKVDANNGVLLVRPTIYPKLFYGSFYDITTQTANTINTPYALKYSNTQISSGFHVANTTQIVAEHAGLYNYQFSLQITSSTSSTADLWVWYRKNGNDVPHTATKISIASNKETEVAAWNFIESMQINEFFELMWATSDVAVSIAAAPETAFCPQVPSVILTVSQVNL